MDVSGNTSKLDTAVRSGAEENEPRLVTLDGVAAPPVPTSLDETGISPEVLFDLTLKLAGTRSQFTTDWAARRLCLPIPMVAELLDRLTDEKLVEILGGAGPMTYRFTITHEGHNRADRVMAVCGYVGPAPVSLEAYVAMLEWQLARLPNTSPERVGEAIADLVLPDQVTHIAGLAISSGRSLFLHGPSGNGKTSLGRLLHQALQGELWVPYCIEIDNHIIRVFDPQCHDQAASGLSDEVAHYCDQRWVRIKRPFIMVGGELTLEALDLIPGSVRGFYEAPLHFKANGGTFLLDDFGCQRAEPGELVNRWIIPLEHQVDYLTLRTGQQIQVPFRQMLIVSTNLNPDDVTAPGFLRRLGYRAYLGNPSEERYARIFTRYAAKRGMDVPSGLVEWLLERYRAEGRPLRSCEPRDLIERARDVCNYHARPPALNRETLTLAWAGYFVDEERPD